MVAATASVAPAVTSTSESGSLSRPQNRFPCSAIAARSAGMPGPGGYWFSPLRSAVTAAASISGGPSVSGKPWPRFTAPVRTASADISAKTVVPKPCRRSAREGARSVPGSLGGGGPPPPAHAPPDQAPAERRQPEEQERDDGEDR